MNSQVGTIERAFHLARSGSCYSLADIRQQLKIEGYSLIESHLDGPVLRKQLAALIREASSK